MAGATLISRHKMDDSDFQRKARKAGDTAREMSDKMKGHFTGVGNAFAGIFAGAVTIAGIKSFADEIDRISVLSKRFKSSAEDMQRLDFISTQNGSDAEKYATALQKANRELADPKNKTAAEAAAMLNLNVKEFLRLDPVAKLAALSDAYKSLGDRDLAAKKLFEIMGRGSVEMIVALETGGAAIKQLASDVNVYSTETASNVEAMNDSIDKSMRNFKANIANGLAGWASIFAEAPSNTPTFADQEEEARKLQALLKRIADDKAAQAAAEIAQHNKDGADLARLDDAYFAVKEQHQLRELELSDQLAKNQERLLEIGREFLNGDDKKRNELIAESGRLAQRELEIKKEMAEQSKKDTEEYSKRLDVLQEERKTWKEINDERMKAIKEATKGSDAAAGFDPQSGLSGLGEANLLKMRGGRRGKGGHGLDYLKGFGMSDGAAFPGLAGLAGLGKQNNDPNQFRKAETEMIRIAKDQFELMKEALSAG